jgi:MoaA/NifB/PqqE/SkfB family radical SAM enzyme
MFSIDGATKETYERIRKPGKWDRLTDNVERFLRARRSLPPWRRPLVDFNYVVMKSNLAELPDFVDLAAGWDAYSITASIMITVDPAIAGEALDEDDPHVRSVLREARRRAWRHGVGFRVAGAQPGLDADRNELRRTVRERALLAWSAVRPVFTLGANYVIERVGRRLKRVPRECPFLWSKAYVQIDGSVGTCCHPRFYRTGDLKRQSIREVWNGSRYRGLRAALNTEHPAGACRDCHLLRP